MGDFFGKKSKRNQTATMNQMNQMIQEQVDEFKGKQQTAQDRADTTRQQYEDFEFTNPFADAQNAFGGIQTEFDNIYGGAKNTFAGAQNTYAGLTNQFAGLENKYEGMENRFEDMTVDMRAADFQAEQGQQQRANIMQGLKGAAGSSGVAGLAQAMANQGQMQSQQIAAGIGQQERQNQMLAAQEGSRIDMTQRSAGMQLQSQQAAGAQQLQGQQAAGAMQAQQMQMSGAAAQQAMVLGGAANAQQLGVSQANIQAQGQQYADTQIMEGNAAVQAAEAGQQATLLGMDYGALAGANAGYQGALSNQMAGMGMKADMYGAQSQNSLFNQAGDVAAAYFGATASDRRLKKNINKISKSPSGLNVYSFEYKDTKHGEGLFQGVMSDEIPKEAVINNGEYDMVNYNVLDVEFKQI